MRYKVTLVFPTGLRKPRTAIRYAVALNEEDAFRLLALTPDEIPFIRSVEIEDDQTSRTTVSN